MSEGQCLGTPLFLVAHGGVDCAALQQLALALHSADRQFKIFSADSSADLPAVARRAALCAHRYHGMVVAAGGGDTEIRAVAHEASRVGCAFGVLPLGTGLGPRLDRSPAIAGA